MPVHAIDDSPSITDLRRARPADATFQNLLLLLSEKIELCGRLAVYEYEARAEDHLESAESFRALAADERASYKRLLRSLTGLIAEGSGDAPEAVPPGAVPRLAASNTSTTAGEPQR